MPTLRRIGFRRHPPVRIALSAIRSGVGLVLYYSGALGFWRRYRRTSGRPIILMYHSVEGRGVSPDIVVSLRHFEAHIGYLRRRHETWSLEELVGSLRAGRVVPPGVVVVTLDDGYRDNYENAWPVLKRYGCPATVFVTVEPVESGRAPWPLVLWRLLHAARRPRLHVSWRSAGGAAIDETFSLRTESGRGRAHSRMIWFAGGLEARERDAFLTAIAAQLDAPLEPREDQGSVMLTWAQLRDMRRGGVDIGSHTMTHPRLTGLDPASVRHELVGSRGILREELGTEIDHFAYPFGWFNADTERSVAAAGYTSALSVDIVDASAPIDLLALGRLNVPDQPVWAFAARLLGREKDSRLLTWVGRHK